MLRGRYFLMMARDSSSWICHENLIFQKCSLWHGIKAPAFSFSGDASWEFLLTKSKWTWCETLLHLSVWQPQSTLLLKEANMFHFERNGGGQEWSQVSPSHTQLLICVSWVIVGETKAGTGKKKKKKPKLQIQAFLKMRFCPSGDQWSRWLTRSKQLTQKGQEPRVHVTGIAHLRAAGGTSVRQDPQIWNWPTSSLVSYWVMCHYLWYMCVHMPHGSALLG